MKIGIISDTHGHFDPRIRELFAGVDHILHGGDIGPEWVIRELEQIAPVTAVLGNNDFGLTYSETEILQLADRKFLVHHIVDVRSPDERLQRRLDRENPDVVVFGHTHQPFNERIGHTLYFNPGYAGKPRFNLRRSVALLQCTGTAITAEFREL
jgi:putative phosphoesterase